MGAGSGLCWCNLTPLDYLSNRLWQEPAWSEFVRRNLFSRDKAPPFWLTFPVSSAGLWEGDLSGELVEIISPVKRFSHPYALQTHSASQILCRRLRFAMNASLFEKCGLLVCIVFEFMLGRTFSELCDLMAHNISVPVSVIDINDWFIGINYLFIWLLSNSLIFVITILWLINPFYFI